MLKCNHYDYTSYKYSNTEKSEYKILFVDSLTVRLTNYSFVKDVGIWLDLKAHIEVHDYHKKSIIV